MHKVDITGRKELANRNIFNGHSLYKALCGNLLHTDRKRLYCAFIPAKEVVQHIHNELIFVIRDDDFITTLPQIIRCRMHRRLNGCDGITFLAAPGIAPRLILEDQEKTACDSLSGADLLDKLQVVFLHQPAVLIGFCFHFLAYRLHMQIDICTAGKHFELYPDRADLQIRNERVDDITLLPSASQQKVDGDNLQNLHIPVVLCIYDSVLYFGNGNVLRH